MNRYIEEQIQNTIRESVFVDVESLIRDIESNFAPEDIFSRRDLEIWALENGYIHESEIENEG